MSNTDQEIRNALTEMGERARFASRILACTDTATKNLWLEAMADSLTASIPQILEANAEDMEQARKRNLSSGSAPLRRRI